MTHARKKRKGELTTAEQKTTTAFKLMSGEIKTLKKSLKNTQDELEKYREKYHESDKNYAVERSKNTTLFFHEILKFIVSVVCGGIGVNLITGSSILLGVGILFLGIILYVLIVLSDWSRGK